MSHWVPGAGFTADLDVMVEASMSLQNTQAFVYDVASGLVGDLSATKGMAGNDATALAFAAAYAPAAASVVDGLNTGAAGVYYVSSALMTAATNYLRQDDANAAAILDRMSPSDPVVPSAGALGQAGCEVSSAMLPEVTGEVQEKSLPVIGYLWPQGDPDRLRGAATAWTSCAELVDQAQMDAAATTSTLSGTWSGDAYEDFRAYEATVYGQAPVGAVGAPTVSGPFLDDVSGACRALAKACTQYADAIDTCRRTLTALAMAAGLTTVAGVALTVFSLGGSDAAAGAADAALIAEAAVAADTLAAEATYAVSAAALTEAAAVVEAAAAAILTEELLAGAALAVPAATGVASLPAGSAYGVQNASHPATGPMQEPVAPPSPPPYGLLTPGQQAAATVWRNGLDTRDPNYGTAAARSYQARIAGAPEYEITSNDGGTTIWADGYRTTDGALIDAKYVQNSGSCLRTLDNFNKEEKRVWESNIHEKDEDELERYGAVLEDGSAYARYLEIDTNNEESIAYWQYLAAAAGTPSNVRYIP